jgi:hypothetical protein
MIVFVQSDGAIGVWRLNVSVAPGLRRGFSGNVTNGDCLRGGNVGILTQMNANKRRIPDERPGKLFVAHLIRLFAARSIRSTPNYCTGAFSHVLYQPAERLTLWHRPISVRLQRPRAGFGPPFTSSTCQRKDVDADPILRLGRALGRHNGVVSPKRRCQRWLVLFAFICVHLRLSSLLACRT